MGWGIKFSTMGKEKKRKEKVREKKVKERITCPKKPSLFCNLHLIAGTTISLSADSGP